MIYQEFSEDGRLVAEGSYAVGYFGCDELLGPEDKVKHGPWKFYDTNGMIKSEISYSADYVDLKNNIKHVTCGAYKTFWPNGLCSAEGTYRPDSKSLLDSGLRARYGAILSSSDRTGLWETYHRNGVRASIGCYGRGGLAVGLWIYYHENGNLKSLGVKTNDAHGFSDNYPYEGTYKEYFENGVLKTVKEFDAGRLCENTAYYENGNLKCIEHREFNSQCFRGLCSYFHENGIIKQEKEYSGDGRLLTEKNYDMFGKLVLS